jgi:CBS domain-containing protein
VTAADVMSAPAVTTRPVVDVKGVLVGVVSRGDLLRPFLRTDEEIREEIPSPSTTTSSTALPPDSEPTCDSYCTPPQR